MTKLLPECLGNGLHSTVWAVGSLIISELFKKEDEEEEFAEDIWFGLQELEFDTST